MSSPWLWPGDPLSLWRTQWSQQLLVPFIVTVYFISSCSDEPVHVCCIEIQQDTWESPGVQPQPWLGSPGSRHPHAFLLLGRLHSSPPDCEAAEPQVHSGTRSGQEQPDPLFSEGCTIQSCSVTASFLLSCVL